MDEQNIAFLHIRTLFDDFRREETYIVEHIAQVNDHSWSITPFNRDLVNRLAFSHKMPRRIEMCAHMVGCLNVLRVDAMLRFAFDVLHFKRWVKRSERTVLIEILR